nr:NADH dehydrogenase subunit 2 [Semimytilus algosus]
MSLVKYTLLNLKLSPMTSLSFLVTVLGTLMSVFSGSWVGMWLGLEINLLGFIVLMNPEGVIAVEPCIKYFIIQSFGSGMLLVGFLAMEFFLPKIVELMLMASLMIKSGLAPFHFWIPPVVNSSNWFVGAMVLSWQKLAPFIMVGWFFGEFVLLLSASLLAIIGGVGGLNQLSVRAMMSYSSMVHTAWMTVALFSSFSLFLIYWVIYSGSVILMFWGCAIFNKTFLKSKMRGYAISCSLFMLSGLPPFLGFFSKVLVFLSVNSVSLFFCVLGSLISLKYYLSFLFSLSFGSSAHDSLGSKSTVWVVWGSIYLNVLGVILLLTYFFW